MYRLGIDIGSTTAKIALVNEAGAIVFSKYVRHNARVRDILLAFMKELEDHVGNACVSVSVTGSIGMGVAEKYGLPFVQEVVAATKGITQKYPQVTTMIDIGGEDAKVVFFEDGVAADLRMNGNCAGGTGAFIDQMAIILGVSVDRMGELASESGHVYPVASRCGVFCKTDIQNLIARNVSKEDIAASVFHAVAVQTVTTLAHGRRITPPVLFCGGPLSFIPALRKSFQEYLSLGDSDVVLPDDGRILTAYGAALSAEGDGMSISRLLSVIAEKTVSAHRCSSGLAPLFKDEDEYIRWLSGLSAGKTVKAGLCRGKQDVFVGIDSGSTTTKIAVIDREGRLLFSFYSPNCGNPVCTVEKGLAQLKKECEMSGTELNVAGSCSTGYGEDLIKAAFRMDYGIIETIAHYRAASCMDRDVSFILDIGGQDMKAIFVNNGIIDRIEINEACSSGCGSFIETFAGSLGYAPEDFSKAACRAKSPCDLGTRCTVFMNSKVKQVLREGASVEDIAAGLCYSVIRNCLYKVLKLKDVSELGGHISVQGGTMRNDAVVRALEILAGCRVTRHEHPELMGALGCALYAKEKWNAGEVSAGISLDEMIAKADCQIRTLRCSGCENHCLVNRYRFSGGRDYYSGNRCEKIFSNSGAVSEKGLNVYAEKTGLLFGRNNGPEDVIPAGAGKGRSGGCAGTVSLKVGIPRILNMYEDYPFWNRLFTECGMETVLSAPSSNKAYESCAGMVMSDNICFPAKLVHSHIRDLQEKGADIVFMPFVVYEKKNGGQNAYNCPIVSGYSEVVKSVQSDVPVESPVITFRDRKALLHQCTDFLGRYGVSAGVAEKAVWAAEREQACFENRIAECCREIMEDARSRKLPVVMLMGRPYHTDPLIQHKVSDMIAGMGVNVISDDIVRNMDISLDDSHFVAQWAYTNRILKAAKWCAGQPGDVQCVQMTSFGCGPDAFLTDAVRDILMRGGKSLTLLKLDDIDNAGSMKLRVRSMIESLKMSGESSGGMSDFRTVPVFGKKERSRKILVPFFTPFISPLIPSVMKIAGYDVENLPVSDTCSAEWGLKYANNEVCYPATLVVGDIIKAYKSGKYSPEDTAVAITQTGGQCRASNYISLIKKALVDAGYRNVPVVSVSFGAGIDNCQPGFKVNWAKIAVPAFYAVLFSDCIAKFYYPSVVREKVKGDAERLKNKYLGLAADVFGGQKDYAGNILGLLREAAAEFDGICIGKETGKVGVVGEIFLKFNTFAHRNVTGWLIERGIEIVPPVLTDFFMQFFVNRKVKKNTRIDDGSKIPEFIFDGFYRFLMDKIGQVNGICSTFRYFNPFGDVFGEAERARRIVSLSAQFGEGWLLPAEIASYYTEGVKNVISLQPFGCIANHIVEKGIENRIKRLYPEINLLSLDFDSGVSDVNITNRMLLFINNLYR